MMHFDFHVALFIMLYKTVLALSLLMKSKSNTIQMKANWAVFSPFFLLFLDPEVGAWTERKVTKN